MYRAKMNSILAAAAAASALLMVSQSRAAGTTYTYTGGAVANWTDAVWSPAGTPAIGDSAIVQGTGGNIAINLTSAQVIGQLYLGTLSGSPFITDIGNGSTANALIMDNTGGTNNTDSFAANANATIYSAGVAGATNIISAPLGLSGAPGGTSSTILVANSSTNSLSLSGGILIDNNTTAVGAGTLLGVTAGVTRTLQMNMTGTNTLTVGPITSRFTGTPTTGVGSTSYNITNALQIGARSDSASGTTNFLTAGFGTTILNGNITNGTAVVIGPNTFNPITQLILGQAGANNGNAIGTIVINGTNTYSGGARLFRANVVLGSDSALGTAALQWGGGAASGAMGFNFFSTDDARTINNNITMQRNLTIKGDHSLTFATGTFSQSNSSNLFNLLIPGKTLTMAGQIATDNGTGGGNAGRQFTFDGPGKTVVSGNIVNSLVIDGALGRVAKNGPGLVVLSGANTYKQFTAANGGVIEFTGSGAVGAQASIFANPGGAIGIDTGATVAFVHPTLGSINMTDLLKAGGVASTGALALATADAAANLNFTTGNLADPKVVGISIGALPGGVSYTGTITPPATGYRLGGGDVLTLPNANALTGANALTATNGGQVVLSNNNDYTGNTILSGNFIVSAQQQAAANIGTSSISTNPVFVPPGVYVPQTLTVSSLADGASSLGNPTDATAANLTINGATLKSAGTGGTSSRLFTIGTQGASLDSSGSAPVNFSNAGALVASDAPTTLTGTTAAASNQITAISDGSALTVGMTVTGTNIPVGATITGVRPVYSDNNAAVSPVTPNVLTYTIFISANATLAATGTALTFGAQNRTLNLTGSNVGDNVITPILGNSATGLLAVNKNGSGKWILNGANTYTGGTSVSNGLLVTNSNFSNGTLTVSGGTAQVAHRATSGETAGVTKVTALSVTGSGRLDLNNNGLILDYTGASPVAMVAAALSSGFNGTAWNGTGIMSSDAAAVAAGVSPNKTALGYAEASQIGSPATFLGVAIDVDSVLVRYTYYGDANLSGNVDSLDFNALAANFGTSGKGWVQGNFNYDPAGVVDSLDFNALAANFGLTLAAPAAGSALGSVVPEPTSLGLIALAGLTGLTRRRRAR